MSLIGPFLVSMAEIAAMAQVKRPVVTNWKRRHVDFPAPHPGVNPHALFDGAEVVAWLIRTGRGNVDAAQLQTELSLHALSAYAQRIGPRPLVELVSSLLCLRHLDGRPLVSGDSIGASDSAHARAELLARAQRIDFDDEFVLHELRGAENLLGDLAYLAENLVEAAHSGSGAHEWLLAARNRLGLVGLSADTLAPELTQLIAKIADVQHRATGQLQVRIADPNARSGDLLTALASQAEDPEQVLVLAAEPDEWLARLIRRRLLLAGVAEISLDIQVGVELEEQIADPDLIVTQLPYQAAEQRSTLDALDAVERVSDLLGSGSTGIVVGPATALIDALSGTHEAKRRSALLRGGVVEAVIGLPNGAVPFRAGYRTAMWVLTRDPVPAARGNVLLIDASTHALGDRFLAHVAEDLLVWRAEGLRPDDGHAPRTGHIVRVGDLNANLHAPLIRPALHPHSHAIDDRPALIGELEHRLLRAHNDTLRYVEEHGALRGRVVRRTGAKPARTTIGTLVTKKRITRLAGHRLAPTHVTPDGTYRVIGSAEISADHPTARRGIDWFTLAAEYEHTILTEPGDVIYTSTPTWAAMVDSEGSSVIEFPARGLRVNPTAKNPLTGRILAALLNTAREPGKDTIARVSTGRVEGLSIPDLNSDEVDRLDALLVEIEQRASLLRQQVDTLAELRRLTLAGVADATLTIETPTIEPE
ncbi:N-6 DNA methylase [Dactylosporangium sp. NPDC049140]|uniref:N-6 DNA methylase n=1 Tax=Dactylosporangium sp. NPDC049140 TaxID=3155647 RepID=UPI0033D80943